MIVIFQGINLNDIYSSRITALLIPINCLLGSLLCFAFNSLFIKALCTVYLPFLNLAKDLRLPFNMSNEPHFNQL